MYSFDSLTMGLDRKIMVQKTHQTYLKYLRNRRRIEHYKKLFRSGTRKDNYKYWIEYYQGQSDNIALPPENEWYKQESIRDRFGNELYIGDIILVNGCNGSFKEFFINKISKSKIMRIKLNDPVGCYYFPNYKLWKDPSFTCQCGHFLSVNFDFIIIKEEFLSNKGKNSLKELIKHKWFRDDYMQGCDREMYSNW